MRVFHFWKYVFQTAQRGGVGGTGDIGLRLFSGRSDSQNGGGGDWLHGHWGSLGSFLGALGARIGGSCLDLGSFMSRRRPGELLVQAPGRLLNKSASIHSLSLSFESPSGRRRRKTTALSALKTSR